MTSQHFIVLGIGVICVLVIAFSMCCPNKLLSMLGFDPNIAEGLAAAPPHPILHTMPELTAKLTARIAEQQSIIDSQQQKVDSVKSDQKNNQVTLAQLTVNLADINNQLTIVTQQQQQLFQQIRHRQQPPPPLQSSSALDTWKTTIVKADAVGKQSALDSQTTTSFVAQLTALQARQQTIQSDIAQRQQQSNNDVADLQKYTDLLATYTQNLANTKQELNDLAAKFASAQKCLNSILGVIFMLMYRAVPAVNGTAADYTKQIAVSQTIKTTMVDISHEINDIIVAVGNMAHMPEMALLIQADKSTGSATPPLISSLLDQYDPHTSSTVSTPIPPIPSSPSLFFTMGLPTIIHDKTIPSISNITEANLRFIVSTMLTGDGFPLGRALANLLQNAFNQIRDAVPFTIVPTTVPSTPSAIVPGTTSAIVPSTPSAIVPGTTSAIVPGTTSAIVPGIPSAIVPSTTSAIVPGTPSAIVPSTTSAIVPGTTSAIVPAIATAASTYSKLGFRQIGRG